MACLIAPATAAIVTTVARNRIPAAYRIGWLIAMLWGGVLMLIVDHLMSGEIILQPPFLTAGADRVFAEIFAVGIPMTIVVFAAWIIMVIVDLKIRKPALDGKIL